MPLTVLVTRDFDHMSEVAAGFVTDAIAFTLSKKNECVLGLATGSSPTGLYKHLARAANGGRFDPGRVRSFNLDEYVGLPGGNAQQRVLHPESYCYFMVRELFGLLKTGFAETCVPYGCLIDQDRLIRELEANPDDWTELGSNAGRWICIEETPASEYLGWIRREVLDGYAEKIRVAGGIDIQVIGVGGRGHVAFHESGIPFENSRVLLVRLDDNTVANAVADGHFPSEEASPRYAVTMGAELVYEARQVLLLASGVRKTGPVAESLLMDPTPDVPISYGQVYSARGGNLVYVVDRAAGEELRANAASLQKKGIVLEDLS